jgi:metal-sulfur cluster biosynthetic enzyme
MLTQQTIMDALQPVDDPELGISIVDLGMVRDIVISGATVEVRMVLTAPFCPLADWITEQVREAVAAVTGVQEARVTLLPDRWDPAWMKQG